jgi:hypothetical protein
MAKKPDDQYSAEESERRLAAALRGSRITGHKPMTDIPKKKPKPKKKPSK